MTHEDESRVTRLYKADPKRRETFWLNTSRGTRERTIARAVHRLHVIHVQLTKVAEFYEEAEGDHALAGLNSILDTTIEELATLVMPTADD